MVIFDIIINVDSTKTYVKVLDVGIETITYKKIENLDGPTYTNYFAFPSI